VTTQEILVRRSRGAKPEPGWTGSRDAYDRILLATIHVTDELSGVYDAATRRRLRSQAKSSPGDSTSR
jgi:hypothetical protein